MMQDKPTDIVGHKTFRTGEIDLATGFERMRHEPLTRTEGNALLAACEKEKADRALAMPDEKAAIQALWQAYQRLKELGWREASYCPKDGTHFQTIEAGSTGIHDCNYMGEWATGSWWIYDGDIWPASPILFKLYPEDQAKEDALWAERKAKFAANGAS